MNTADVILLMLPAFAECLVLVGIHSYLGIHVIERKVIFVDLALAQIAALGTLIAFLFGIAPHTAGAYLFSVGLTAVAAAVFALCRFREGKIPQEAVIGLVYAIAAATAILLIDKAPHGAEHIKEILTGSILWVEWPSIALAAAVYAVVGAFHYAFRRRFLLISRHPEEAWARGWNVRFWDFLFYLSFGVVITLSVDTAGVLIVFVFLVAPAIVAMSVTDRLGLQLGIGWTLGLLVTCAGLVLSYAADLPTGPAVIGSYGAAILLLAVLLHVARAPSPLAATRNVLLAGLGFAAFAGLLCLLGTLWPRHAPHPPPGGRAHAGAPAPPPDVDRRVEKAEEMEDLARVFRSTEDPQARLRLVRKALERDEARGARLALEYLASNPPPFFRQEACDLLDERAGEPLGWDPFAPMEAEGNRRALERARSLFGRKGDGAKGGG